MGKNVIKTIIQIGGKYGKSLQAAFKAISKDNDALERGFKTVKAVGVTSFKAIAGAVTAIGTATIAAAESTREFRQDLSKMYSNAERAGVSTSEAFGGLEDLYAISGEFDSANEAMSNLLATGYKGEDLTKVIEAINGATVKWQDTIKQESLADAINETVMSGKSVGQFDEILARSGVNLDSFNDGLLNCGTLAERQQYVLSWLSKSGLTEVNAAYQEQNKSLVEAYKADLQYQNAMAKLGEVAEPIATLFKGFMAGAITFFAEKLKGVNFESVSNALKKVGELGKKAFDTLWGALEKIDWDSLINSATTILTVFTEIFNFVVNNWSMISPVIYTVVGALVAYKVITMAINTIEAISNSLKSISAARSVLKAGGDWAAASAAGAAAVAQNGLNLAFLACPITWIVLGIMAIVAIFVLLWNKCEGFRNFWKALWEKIKEAFNIAKEKITSGIQAIKDKFQPVLDVAQKLIGKFKEVGEAIKNSKIGKAVSGAKNWISDKWSKITGNAAGGTYSSPLLTWVSEAGDTETIVPHNNKPRSRALALEAVKGTGLNMGGNTFVFSPQITAYGGGASELRSILEDERNKFIAQMEEWASGQRRLAY